MNRRTEEFEKPLDPNPAIASYLKRHGNYFLKGNSMLFEDGAVAERSGATLGAMLEPPEDDRERQLKIVNYLKLVARQARDEFIDLQSELADPDSKKTLDDDEEEAEALAELKSLRKEAREAKAKLHEAEAELQQVTPAWMAARDRERARAEKRRAKFKGKVLEIRL